MKEINMAKVFKALSCEQRLHLFEALYEWCETEECKDGDYSCSEGMDKCFTKACCCMDLSKSTISHHFKELQNAGLISYTRKGQSFLCKINKDVVESIQNFMK